MTAGVQLCVWIQCPLYCLPIHHVQVLQENTEQGLQKSRNSRHEAGTLLGQFNGLVLSDTPGWRTQGPVSWTPVETWNAQLAKVVSYRRHVPHSAIKLDILLIS